MEPAALFDEMELSSCGAESTTCVGRGSLRDVSVVEEAAPHYGREVFSPK